MCRLTGVSSILYYIQITNAIRVQVDGLIDLGSNWSYEYKIITPKLPDSNHQSPSTNQLAFSLETPSIATRTQHRFPKIKEFHEEYSIPATKTVKEIIKSKNYINLEKLISDDDLQIDSHNGSSNNVINTYKEIKVNEPTEEFISNNNIYIKTRAIKDDEQINTFIRHVFKQALEVFRALRDKTDDYRIKKYIDLLIKYYKRKFKEFIADTKNQNIKSRLGAQKVILNTIDVSNRILTRLVNFLISDMNKKGLLRNSLTTANIFQMEIKKESELEYKHACTKFGVCRTSSGFLDFISDLISIVLVLDDKKLKLCIDSFTEAFLSNADFSKFLDKSTKRILKRSVKNLGGFDPFTMKAILMIAKNIINNKNGPLIVHNRAGGRINQTLAFLELIDIIDENIPSSEENKLEWNDLKGSLQQWIDGKRTDIMEIMESFVNMLKKVMESFDSNILEKANNIVKNVFV